VIGKRIESISQERNMKTERYTAALPVYMPQSEDTDEGSLNFGQILAALRRQLLLIGGVTALVASASAYKAFTDTPVYMAQFEILTQPVTAESQLISSISNSSNNRDQQDSIVDSTKLKVLTSPTVLQPIVDQIKIRYPEINYVRLFKNLDLSASKVNRNVLQVSYKGADAAQVEAILETVAQSYLDYSLKSRQVDIRQGINFVQNQLPLLESRVEKSQRQLQELRQRNALVDPESRGQQLIEQSNSFSQQQLEVEVQLKQFRAIEARLESQIGTQSSEAASSSALDNAPRYQSLKNQLLELDSQQAQSAALFLPNSPDLKLMTKQRQNLVSLLKQESGNVQTQIDTQIQELELRDRALQETISSLNGKINQLSGVAREYALIQQELQISTANLNQFLTKQAALEIEGAQREVPWQLLTPPTEPKISTASVERNVTLGALLGLVLGIALVLTLDKFNNTLYDSKALKRITSLPLLGVIPYSDTLYKSEEPTEIAAFLNNAMGEQQRANGNGKMYTDFSFVEAFRSLSTNIRLLNPSAPTRALVVSSAISEEGKSIVATCLAQAMAAMGQRVLLIDADLRNPQIHHYGNLTNHQGLTNVIVGDVSFEEAVQRSPLSNNLFVLTAGSIPPDATQFLASPKMKTLVEQSLDDFDLIIYDTPPLLGFADASLMTAYANGLLLVAGLGKIKSTLLEQALEQLQISGISVLGMVATGAKEQLANLLEAYPTYYPQAPKGKKTELAAVSEPSLIKTQKSLNEINTNLRKFRKP
jgi:polysaccharide biosynthesis transport protein